MTFDIVNAENRKVGSLELKDEVFGGRANTGLIWASVVHANAAARRGTHATKNRALVSGSGRKPWRQKGTGRARVGDIRNPLWRKGGTVSARSRGVTTMRCRTRRNWVLCERRSLSVSRMGPLVIVDSLDVPDGKTKSAAELLSRLGANDKTLLLDVTPGDMLTRAVRNLPGVNLVTAGRVRARDVMNTTRVIASQAAIERLQQTLAASAKASASQGASDVVDQADRRNKLRRALKARGTGRGGGAPRQPKP